VRIRGAEGGSRAPPEAVEQLEGDTLPPLPAAPATAPAQHPAATPMMAPAPQELSAQHTVHTLQRRNTQQLQVPPCGRASTNVDLQSLSLSSPLH
jgi:hypothetical protein